MVGNDLKGRPEPKKNAKIPEVVKVSNDLIDDWDLIE
jgi:hypothetical protein